jgi:hypothetical protein
MVTPLNPWRADASVGFELAVLVTPNGARVQPGSVLN